MAAASTIDTLIEHAGTLRKDIADAPAVERRQHERHAYHQLVILTLLTPDGKPQITAQATGVDISKGGLCLDSRTMLYPGAIGIARLPKSNGESTIVGIQVRHCRYIGNMTHRSGLRFIALPMVRAEAAAAS